MAYTAYYWRHRTRHETTCYSLLEALCFLKSGEEDGALSSEKITGPDGFELEEEALFAVLNGEVDLVMPVTEASQ